MEDICKGCEPVVPMKVVSIPPISQLAELVKPTDNNYEEELWATYINHILLHAGFTATTMKFYSEETMNKYRNYIKEIMRNFGVTTVKDFIDKKMLIKKVFQYFQDILI